VQRETLPGLSMSNDRTRLDRIGGDTRIMQRKPGDVGSLGKRLVDGSAITALEPEAHVARRVLPDLGSAFGERILEGDGRQDLIVHSEQFSRIFGLVERSAQ